MRPLRSKPHGRPWKRLLRRAFDEDDVDDFIVVGPFDDQATGTSSVPVAQQSQDAVP